MVFQHKIARQLSNTFAKFKRYCRGSVITLRNAKVTGIQVYTAGSISATPLTGSTPVTTADLKKSFLTLYEGDLQLIYNTPLVGLNNIVNSAADPYTFELPAINGITISWVKSYVVLPTALSTTNVAYSFGVYYHF